MSTQRGRNSEQTLLHHDREELDDDLGGRADEHLALATSLGIDDGVEGVVEHRDADHSCDVSGCSEVNRRKDGENG